MAGVISCTTSFLLSLSRRTTCVQFHQQVARSDNSQRRGVPCWTTVAFPEASNSGMFGGGTAGLWNCKHCRLCICIPLHCRSLGVRASQIRGLLAGTAGHRPGAQHAYGAHASRTTQVQTLAKAQDEVPAYAQQAQPVPFPAEAQQSVHANVSA